MSFNYVDVPDSNLICCICRTPFVDPVSTRSCSHTFCRDCIIHALSHSSHCPIDRSPLKQEDLISANPIIRSLVDEMMVLCFNSSDGCEYTSQRQLLATHIRDSCMYERLPCPTGGCAELIPRKDLKKHRCLDTLVKCEGCETEILFNDLEGHQESCLSKKTICKHCGEEMSLRSLSEHHSASCPNTPTSCKQSSNGCNWHGTRSSLNSHLTSCPYEAIKGFFSIHSAQLTSLRTENELLKWKVESLEGVVQALQTGLTAAQLALGPWGRMNRLNPQAASSSRFLQHVGPAMNAEVSFIAEPSSELSSISDPRFDISAYFPSEQNLSTSPQRSPSYLMARQVPTPMWDTAALNSQHAIQTTIAPLNLNSTLEGTLTSLRESLVTLAASVDSLGRHSEIALSNETSRLNEEVMSLRGNVHGLRMQVHSLMLERNAQVTSIPNDMISQPRFPFFPGAPSSVGQGHSITKL